jgi:hypothetical protein
MPQSKKPVKSSIKEDKKVTPKATTSVAKTTTQVINESVEQVSASTTPSFGASLEKARNTKSTRLWFLVLLAAIIFVLWWLKIIKTWFAIWLGIVVLAVIGIQTFDYDLDLQTLWKTGDISESRVQQTKDGIKLMGSCVKLAGKNANNDLNCVNFKTQPEAQAKYDTCATQIASYNAGQSADSIKNLDIYGLDGNKNGIVCEALPAN